MASSGGAQPRSSRRDGGRTAPQSRSRAQIHGIRSRSSACQNSRLHDWRREAGSTLFPGHCLVDLVYNLEHGGFESLRWAVVRALTFGEFNTSPLCPPSLLLHEREKRGRRVHWCTESVAIDEKQ
jgi:hypothetical protein